MSAARARGFVPPYDREVAAFYEWLDDPSGDPDAFAFVGGAIGWTAGVGNPMPDEIRRDLRPLVGALADLLIADLLRSPPGAL